MKQPIRRTPLFAALALFAFCASAAQVDSTSALQIEAQRDGVREVQVVAHDDGGLQLDGTLAGHQFALVIPKDWNHQAMLFEHGSSAPGTPIKVAENPLEHDAIGLFSTPYAQGFLVGHSAYDKAGQDIEGGYENSWRLARFVHKLGASKTYLVGASMGGSVVLALLEKHPHAFVGALIGCGAVGDYVEQVRYISRVRSAYDAHTRGTAYELPGAHDPLHNALPSPDDAKIRDANAQALTAPILALFADARKNPDGDAAKMIAAIARDAGIDASDPASFVAPIVKSGLGMDDIVATYGGDALSDAHAAARAHAWYRSSGKLPVPVLTLHNALDPLAPRELHEGFLRDAAHAAGRSDLLVQRTVLTLYLPMAKGSELQGSVHCGFNAQQVGTAWNDLRHWVETGEKPKEN